MIWFTSDEHYGHKNMLTYEDRPFDNVDILKSELIDRSNAVVKPNDEVWHIGDFSMFGRERPEYFKGILSRLNGRHHLVLGNHDRLKPFTYVRLGFASVHTAMQLPNIDDYRIILAHDPATYVAMSKDTVLLCGHVHSLFSDLLPKERVINVGVDVRNFTPISIEEIIDILN